MVLLNDLLDFPNAIANKAISKGYFEKVDDNLKNLLKKDSISPKPLLVCSGGTTTRCAADGHWTIDLRKNYNHLKFDRTDSTIEIGAGLTMGRLAAELAKEKRSFPIGLSGITGLGYILTGGISPLSRSQELAIDNVLGFKGIWGNGNYFEIKKPAKFATKKEKIEWKSLCGASPFLAIITSIKAKTFDLEKLIVWQGSVSPIQLSKAINHAEKWVTSASLQWIWDEEIKLYVVIKADDMEASRDLSYLIKSLSLDSNQEIINISGIHQLPEFSSSKKNPLQKQYYYETISLLSPVWGESTNNIIDKIKYLMKEKPSPGCCIAAQQLGGKTSLIDSNETSFIYRESIWKPWITATWDFNNESSKKASLNWLNQSWSALQPSCQGVHLAQMHPHLPWHKKEIEYAYGNWLAGLKRVKSYCDPNGILPSL